MPELQQLYNVLIRDGYYTKSFEEFTNQMYKPDYQRKVYDIVTRDRLFTAGAQEFSNKYLSGLRPKKVKAKAEYEAEVARVKEEKKKAEEKAEEKAKSEEAYTFPTEMTDVYKADKKEGKPGDLLLTEEAKKDKIDFDPVNIPAITKETTDLEEDEVAEMLNETYGKYGAYNEGGEFEGFKFNTAGLLTDRITITGPGGEVSPEFPIDNWSGKEDAAQAAAMTKWIRDRASVDSASTLLASLSEVAVTDEQKAQNATDDDNIFENYLYNVETSEKFDKDKAREREEEEAKASDIFDINNLEPITLGRDVGPQGIDDTRTIIERPDTHVKNLIQNAKKSIAIKQVMDSEEVSFEDAIGKHKGKIENIIKDLADDDPEVKSKALEYLGDESYARSMSKNVADYVDEFEGGLFAKGGQQKVLEKEAEEQLKQLKKDDERFVKEFAVVENGISNIDTELGKLAKKRDGVLAEIRGIRNKEYTTQAGVDAANTRLEQLRKKGENDRLNYNKLLKDRKVYVTTAGKLLKDQKELQLKEKDLNVYFKAIGRNYQPGTVLGVTLGNAIIDIGANLEEFAYALNPYVALYDYLDEEEVSPIVKSLITGASMYVPAAGVIAAQAQLGTSGQVPNPHFDKDKPESESNPKTISYRDSMVNNLHSFQEELRNSIAEPQRLEDIESWGDLGMWAGTTLAQQAPLLAMMYATGGTTIGTLGSLGTVTAAEGLIFASSAGGKFRSMKQEMDQYDIEYSNLALYSTAMLTGLTETLSEQITLGQMKAMKGVLAGNKAAKLGFKNFLKKEVWNADNLLYAGKDFLREGGSEAIATISENFWDKNIAGKDVGIYDGVEEAFASGVLISGAMKTPSLYRAMTAPFRSRDTNQKVGENAARINKLEKLVQSPDISLENKIEYESEIADLIIENNKLIESDVKRVDVLDNNEKADLIRIEKANHFYRQRAENIIADDSLTKEQKAEEIQRLQDKVRENQNRKQEIIEKYPPQDVEDSYQERMEWLKGQAAMVEKEGGIPVNIIETDTEGLNEYQISREADDITFNQGFISQMQEVVKDPNSTPEEIAEAQNYLKELKKDKGGRIKKMLNVFKGNASNYGAMTPQFDADGKVTSYDLLVNKETSITDGMFNTAAHEFIHAAFYNTLKQDPVAQSKFGKELLDILENDKDVSYTEKGMGIFNRRAAQYTEKEGQGEEMFAITTELMQDNDVSISEKGFDKLKGIFRRFAQNRLGYDIRFDTKQDIKNFMKDYHKSVKDNKPSKAIARMMVKGAKGKLVEGAKTPQERADQEQFSKAVELNTKSNPDLRSDIDGFVKNEDGTPKHENNEEFKLSPEYTDAYSSITESKLLNGLIQQGMVAKGLPPAALKEFTRKVKEKIGERYLKNYNLDKNDSLFGWLTGVSGGAGMSIIYRAKGDVMNEYKAEIETVSISKPVGEAGTLADILLADRSTEMEAFENEDLSPGRKEAYIEGPQPVLDLLELSDTKEVVDNAVDKVQKGKNKVNLEGLTYKGVKPLLTGVKKITRIDKKTGKVIVDKKTKKPKLFNPTKVSDVIPTGSLYNVLKEVASVVGIDPKRILANQTLDDTQRKAAQEFIYTKIVNEDGSFNTTILDNLPEGETKDGEATGVANTAIGLLYLKGERAVYAEGATAAGKFTQTKRTDVTMEEMLDLFGINPDGSFRTDTKADPAIRTLTTVLTQLAANQSLRENAIVNGTYPEAVIAQLGNGKAKAAWSKNINAKPSTQEIIDEGWPDLMNEVAASSLTKEEVANAVDNVYKDSLSKTNKNKAVNLIMGDVSGFISINETLKDGFREITSKDVVDFLIEKFEGRQWEQGIKKMLMDVLPLNEKGKPIDPGNLAKDIEGATKQRAHLVNQSANITNEFGVAKGLEMIISQLGPVYAKMAKIGDGSLTTEYPGGPVIINKDFVGPTQNRNQVTTGMPDFIALISKGLPEGWSIKKIGKNYVAVSPDGKNTVLNTTLLAENSEAFIKDKNFEGRKQQSQDARNISETMLDNAWKRANDTSDQGFDMGDFGLLAMSLGSSMESPLKRAANAEYIQDGIEKIIKRGKARGLPMKNIVRYEHMKSKERVISDIINSYRTEGKLNPKVWDDYQVQVISVIADDLMNDAGFKTKSTFDGLTRLFNEFTLKEIIENPLDSDGKPRLNSIAPIRSLDPAKKGKQTETIGSAWVEAVKKVMELKKTNATAKSGDFASIGKVMRLATTPQFSKNTKGMSAWDFDDTVARTKSGVIAKTPNDTGVPKPGRKVIFLAGGAGSGKSNVVRQLGLEDQGFKIVNQDISLEWLKKNHGLPEDMNDLTKEQASLLGKLGWEARRIAARKQMKFQGKGDGIIVDGTGGSMNVMKKQVQEFKDKGYEVQMLFVETSLETALERNRNRKERSLKDIIVIKNHEAVQNNKKGFRELFGDNFAEVKTDNLKLGDPMPQGLVDKINSFSTDFEVRRLTAEEFAVEGADILEQGGEFDFREFDVVTEGEKGPLFGKAMDRAKKYGLKDNYILTARPHAAKEHIYEFLKSQGLEIPLENVITLENSTPEAKALWIAEKVGEGYNDIYFADDALQNVQAVDNMMDQFDIKGKVQQVKIQFSKDGSSDFNKILEGTKGLPADYIISRAKARQRGKKKGNFQFWIPPSADDFAGLLQRFQGKGKQGMQDAAWLKEKLLDPFARGDKELNAARQRTAVEFKALKKQFPDISKKLRKEIPTGDYNYGDAVRVYLWDKAGMEIPGLSKTDKQNMIDLVNSNPDFQSFAEVLGQISRKDDGYVSPDEYWMTKDIVADITEDGIIGDGRKEHLGEWIENKNIIFSPENLNKIEFLYGSNFREALDDVLYRMENGSNRPTGKNRIVNNFLNWLNGGISVVMNWNSRSAVLQTLSTVNFINWGDNNVAKAAARFANQKQFWKDFAFIFNSDMLKQRRAGLKTTIESNELMSEVEGSVNPVRATIRYLLRIGFTPTKIADSFAIAMGGSSFYRNRIKTYEKQGYTKQEAEQKSWLDFQEVAEATQQSSRPDRISMQQASTLGRLILAFQNTPMQYMRLTKKEVLDLVNGRYVGFTGPNSFASKTGKIMYYTAIQNAIFYSMQSALFAMAFGDEDDEEFFKKKKHRVADGMADGVLRGLGVGGAVVSTIKNMMMKYAANKDKGFNADESSVLMEFLKLSPPLSIKARQILSADKTMRYNKNVIKQMETLDIDNPIWSAMFDVVEATTNLPLSRMQKKFFNVRESLNQQNEAWQRLAMFFGWSRWDVGVDNQEIEEIKKEIKKQKTYDRKKKAQEKKQAEQAEEQAKISKQVEKEKELEEKGLLKDPKCRFVTTKGSRCKTSVANAGDLCTIHEQVPQRVDGKKTQCKKVKKGGVKCKMQTSNKSGYCYYHD